MLFSLPRVRRVVEISYGCMGRSARHPSTAKASGLFTRRRVIDLHPPIRILGVEYVASRRPSQAISRSGPADPYYCRPAGEESDKSRLVPAGAGGQPILG